MSTSCEDGMSQGGANASGGCVVTPLTCGYTRCYLVTPQSCPHKSLLFDTGSAGSLGELGRQLKLAGGSLADIGCLLVSHYHPDHMGIARDLMDLGVTLLLPTVQQGFVHEPDKVYAKNHDGSFKPIGESMALTFPVDDSREILGRWWIQGQVAWTPGHSDDSISLLLDGAEDGREALVGDLCPLEQVELYNDPVLEQSWEKLIALGARRARFAHWPDETL